MYLSNSRPPTGLDPLSSSLYPIVNRYAAQRSLVEHMTACPQCLNCDQDLCKEGNRLLLAARQGCITFPVRFR